MKKYRKNKVELCLSENVINIFTDYKQLKSRSKESGGILLGQTEKNKFYITRVSLPNKFDKQSRYSFVRNKDIAQIISDFEYFNSEKKTIYLGEWHTHPEPIPTPSNTDLSMIKEEFKKAKNIQNFLFLVIQGQKELYIGLYDGKQLIQMEN